MAELAIKGHSTRGKEVIEILEMLGGKIRRDGLAGNEVFSWYYINGNGYIDYKHYSLFHDATCFALEKFLEMFPYKVGDKVNYVKYNDECPSVYTIQRMRWTGVTVEYLLDSSGFSALTKDLQPYKEETMDKAVFDANAQCCDIMNHLIKKETMEGKIESFEVLESHCANEVKIEFDPSKFEIVKRDNGYYVVKKQPQYPKTYEECCRIVNANPFSVLVYRLSDGQKYSYDVDNLQHYENIRKLLICRDAYWRYAGEQIGGPWRPNWYTSEVKFTIVECAGIVVKSIDMCNKHILAFPTEEMRDAFYENFKELIEQCKELL